MDNYAHIIVITVVPSQPIESTDSMIHKIQDNVCGIYSSKKLARNFVNRELYAMQREVFVNNTLNPPGYQALKLYLG